MTAADLARKVAHRRLRESRADLVPLTLLLGFVLGLGALSFALCIRAVSASGDDSVLDSTWAIVLQVGTSRNTIHGGEQLVPADLAHRFEIERPGMTSVGRARRMSVDLTIGEESTLHRAMVVSQGFWKVVRPALVSGRVPRSDAGEALVSQAFLDEHIKSRGLDPSAVVLGSSGRLLRIVGVMERPLPWPGRQPATNFTNIAADVVETTEDALLGAPAASTGARLPIAIIGVSNIGRTEIGARVSAWVEREASSRYGETGVATVVSLERQMFGERQRFAMVAAILVGLLLALAAVSGGTTFASRIASRRHFHSVLEIVGVPPADVAAFDRAEIRAVMSRAAAISLPIAACTAGLILSQQSTRGMLDMHAALAWFAIWPLLAAALWAALSAALPSARADSQGPTPLVSLRSGARQAVSLGLLRLVRGGQFVVLLALSTVVASLIVPVTTQLVAVLGLRVSDVYEVRLRFPENTPDSVASEAAREFRSGIARSPLVASAALSTLPALELEPEFSRDKGLLRGDDDWLVGYSGPRGDGPTTLVSKNPDGSRVYAQHSDGQAIGELVHYQLVLVKVEPEFFGIMGFSVDEGRVFLSGEANAVVLAADAAAFFRSGDVVGPLQLSAPPPDLAVPWHSGLEVVGVVSPRVVEGPISGRIPGGRPLVAFRPFGTARWSDGAHQRHLYVVLKARPGSTSEDVIKDVASRVDITWVEGEVRSLAASAREKAAVSGVVLGFGLLLGLVVILAAMLAAFSGARTLVAVRRQELATRIAIGMDEDRLVRSIAVRELRWPVLLAVSIVAVFGLLEALVGGALPSTFPGLALSLGAAAALLAADVFGLAMGLKPVFDGTIMSSLQDE